MKRIKVMDIMMVLSIVILVCVVAVQAGETKYASGTTSAAVNFSPSAGMDTIKSIYATTDLAGGTVKIYAWNKVKTQSPTTAPAATNLIDIDNSDTQLDTSDYVMYVHADGTLDYRTVSSSTASNVTLNAVLSQTGSVSDRLYELTQQAQLDFDTAGAGVSTNKYGKFEGDVFTGIGPIRVVQDGTSNAVVNVTKD